MLSEYPVAKVAHITGLSVEDIERFAREYARSQELFGGPALIRLNYGLQRHGGGGMAVRTIVCLPALTGDWRHPGGGALLSTSKVYPFDDNDLDAARPDPARHAHRSTWCSSPRRCTANCPARRCGRSYVYNSNPAAVCPDQSRVLAGLEREDLFTVVHEQFQTDTADYADIVLPATTQLEHFDIHGSYGHLYVQANDPAIAPLGEAKPNTEVFRLLARAMGFEPELFEVSDEELARGVWRAGDACGLRPRGRASTGITLEATKAGPVRLNLPENWAPFAEGKFATPSGKCELYSEREARAGRDPLPHYAPPHEDPQTRPDLAAKYPLQMLSPPAAGVPELDVRERRRAAQRRRRADGGDAPRRRGDARHRRRPDGERLQRPRPLPGEGGRRRDGEAGRRGVARHLVEEVHRRRRELQRDDEHRPDRPRRRRHVLRQPGGSRGDLSSTTSLRFWWDRHSCLSSEERRQAGMPAPPN